MTKPYNNFKQIDHNYQALTMTKEEFEAFLATKYGEKHKTR